jgi:hypothetical protein
MSKLIEAPPRKEAGWCIAPEMGALLRDYHEKNLRGEEELNFEAHLLLCAECSQRVATLDWIDETFDDEVAQEPVLTIDKDMPVYLAGAQSSMMLNLLAGRSPTFYIIGGLGGISLLGVIAFGVARYIRQSRPAPSARQDGAQAQGSRMSCAQSAT